MQMMTNTMAGFRVYHVSEASVLYLLEDTATTTTTAEETSTDAMTTEDYTATTATASEPAVNLN